MSTTQIFTIAGTVIGAYFGYPQLGAVIGGLVGSQFEPDTETRGPRLDDRRVQVSTYGASIPYVFGGVRIAGNVIWSNDIEEVETETEQDGKGGPSNTQITYTYFGTFAVLLGVGPLRGIRRIWADAVLIFDGSVIPNIGDVSYTFYSGSEDQLPDPTIEAALGVGNVPAYRGSSYVVFHRLALEKFGNRLPSITVELLGDGEFQSVGTAIGTAPPSPGYATLIRSAIQRPDGNVVYMTYPNATGVGTSAGIVFTVVDQFTGLPVLTGSHPTVVGTSGLLSSAVGNLMIYVPGIDQIWVSCAGSIIECFSATTLEHLQTITLTGGYAMMAWDSHTRRVFFRPSAQWVCAGGSSVVLAAGAFNIDVLRSAFLLVADPMGTPLPGPTSMGSISVEGDVWYETDDAVITTLPTVFMTDGSAAGALACFDPTRGRYVVVMNRIWTVTDADPPTIAVQAYPPGMSVGIYGSVTFDSSTDSIVILSGVVGIENATILDAGTFELRYQGPVTGNGNLGNTLVFPQSPGTFLAIGSHQLWEFDYFGTTLAATVQRLAIESGLEAGDIDVTQLGQRLRGFVVSQPGPARAAIEQLARDYLFLGVEEDDKMVFRKRGGATVATIPDSDCGAAIDPETPKATQSTRAQESDLPARFSVTAPDPALDYQPDTQYGERRAAHAGQEAGISSAVVMTATENKRLADALIFDRWASRESLRWSTTRKYAHLSPTDPILLAGRRVRITSRSDDGGAIRWEGLVDDADVVVQTSTGVQGEFPGQTPSIQVPTVMVVLDTALLADAQNDAGAYVAAYGVAPYWRGAVIYDSSDGGTTWSRLATMPRPGSSMGYATTALGNWTGGNVFDEVNSVNVSIANAGTLSSTTRAGVLAGNNAIAINGSDGWEVLQYRTATLEANGTYTLTGLLRGRRGTGFAMGGHAAGDRAVPLSPANLRDLPITNSQIGVELPFKAVSIGDTLSGTTSTNVTITAERLKPWSPVDFRALRDVGSGDITMTWKRRTRLACRFVGAGGINVPLGEDSEAYVVRIYDSGYTTLKRSISVSGAATASYSAADQTTDFGGPQSTVYVRITQTSAIVGAGHELEAAA